MILRAMNNRTLQRDIRKVASKERAAINKWFFKTGPGDYGEGDRFLGITVPDLRALAHRYQELPRKDVVRLLKSKWQRSACLPF
jgi:hypothetical protein